MKKATLFFAAFAALAIVVAPITASARFNDSPNAGYNAKGKLRPNLLGGQDRGVKQPLDPDVCASGVHVNRKKNCRENGGTK